LHQASPNIGNGKGAQPWKSTTRGAIPTSSNPVKRPAIESCRIKEKLIAELQQAHARAMGLWNQEAEAAIRGDLSACAVLAQQYRYSDARAFRLCDVLSALHIYPYLPFLSSDRSESQRHGFGCVVATLTRLRQTPTCCTISNVPISDGGNVSVPTRPILIICIAMLVLFVFVMNWLSFLYTPLNCYGGDLH
jgi:hypothetical protein